MIYHLVSAGELSPVQISSSIPPWVWVILGIIALAVILGLILGARTSVYRSPSVRDRNIREGDIVIPTTGVEPPENMEIPQKRSRN